jgi:hypothetical protein
MGYPASQHPMAAKELEVMGVESKERPGRLAAISHQDLESIHESIRAR